jgi:ABC-2 type transport system ATP-binding protein
LDPEHRAHIWNGFRQLSEMGRTILVTTHIMDEAARCDTVVMLRQGKIIAQDSPDELLRRTRSTDLEQAFLKLGAAQQKSQDKK